MPLRLSLSIALALGLVACASQTPPVDRPAKLTPRPTEPETPLAHSSIAAVLDARGALGLTDEQVKELEALDAELEETNDQVWATYAKAREAATTAKAKPEGGAGIEVQGQGRGGMGGGAMAGDMGGGVGGGMGGGRGMGRGGHHRGVAIADRPKEELTPYERARQQTDDNDSAFYLRAEELLTEAQRPRARELATRHRERLFERRAGAGE